MLGGVLVRQVGGDAGGLGQAEAVADPGAGERLLDPVDQVGRDRRAAVGQRHRTAETSVVGEVRLLIASQ